jgi:hypothetical protein
MYDRLFGMGQIRSSQFGFGSAFLLKGWLIRGTPQRHVANLGRPVGLPGLSF